MKLISLFLLAAFAIAALVLPTRAGTLTVRGTVSYPNGSPAANVVVELHTGDGSFSRNTTTASDGSYTFTETLADGIDYGVEIRPPEGYTRPSDVAGYSFKYTEGLETQTFNFTLALAPKIVSGKVTDTNDNPVVNASISFFPALQGAREGTTTDSNGTYTKQLRGGRWYANAEPNLSEQDVHWTNNNLPVLLDFSNDNSVESDEQNFVVTEATGNLKVQLLNSDGRPLTTSTFVADISIRRPDGIGTMRKVDGDSRLNIWITPGIYSITAYHRDLEGKSFNPEQTTFVMTENGTVDLGVVRAEENRAHLKGKVLTKTDGLSNAQIEAIREGGSERVVGNTGSDGSYDLTTGAGTWVIGLRFEAGSNSQYVQSSSARATVKNGETVTGLNIKAVQVDGTIAGKVLTRNGATATDFIGSVYVRTLNNQGRVFSPVINGEFTLRYSTSEITGSKMILGAQSAPGSAYAGGNEVTIFGKTTQNITLQPFDATLKGTLRLQNGTPVTNSGSNILMVAVDDQGNFSSSQVNPEDGTYALPLASGTWFFDYEIENPELTDGLMNRPAGQNALTIKAGQTMTKDLITPQGKNTITGTVTDADEHVVQQAHVTIDNRPNLENNDATNPNAIVTLTSETNDAGTYSVEVPNGTYLITVGDTPAIEQTQLPPDGQTVTVRGNSTTTVNLVFEDTNAKIMGTVKFNNKPDSGGMVTAYTDDGAQTTAEIGKNGTFLLNVTNKETWHLLATDFKEESLLSSDVVDLFPKSKTTKTQLNLEQTDLEVPGPVTKTFSADEGGNVSLHDGTTVTVPPFAIDTSGTVSLTVAPTIDLDPTTSDRPASLAYEIRAEDSQSREVKRLNREMTVSLPYEQETLEENGLNEKNLSTKFFNPLTQTWETSGVAGLIDPIENTATFTTAHLTKFSVTGTTKKAPLVSRARLTSLSHTSATFEFTGKQFEGKVSATIGNLKSSKVNVNSTGTSLIVTIDGRFKDGSYDIVIKNGNGRLKTIRKGFTLKSGNAVFKLK